MDTKKTIEVIIQYLDSFITVLVYAVQIAKMLRDFFKSIADTLKPKE